MAAPALTNPEVTEIEPGVLAGPMRNVVNPGAHLGAGSIHDAANFACAAK